MHLAKDAARAYAATASARSHREQEADLFWRVNTVLDRSRTQGPLERARALADNRRLWALVIGLLRDPDNALPPPLRASIISVGLCVQREMDGKEPNIDFLLSVNENIAAGLAGRT